MNGAWWGVIAIIIIMIVAIIVVVFLNKGNLLDIIAQLPAYRIYYPTNNTFMGLTNLPNPLIQASESSYPAELVMWIPVVTLTLNADLNRWKFLPATTTSFDTDLADNESIQYLINDIYNATSTGYALCQPGGGCTTPTPSPVGFVATSPEVIQGFHYLQPNVNINQATQFIYVNLGNNMFQLKSTATGYVAVSASGVPFVTTNTAIPIATFQLLPLSTT